MHRKYDLKPGHPPLDQLSVRMTTSVTYQPNLADYRDFYDGISEYNANKVTFANVFEAMQEDARCLDEGHTDLIEMLMMWDADTALANSTTFELVDSEGTVWTTEHKTLDSDDL